MDNNFNESLGDLLFRLRKKKGLSKSKMALMMDVNEHTYYKYESGDASPSVESFIKVFKELDEDPSRHILNILYPDVFHELTPKSDIEDLRNAAAFYLQTVAPEKMVKDMLYIVSGNHGSSVYAMIQEFNAVAHLPMEYRVFIAEDIFNYYTVAAIHHELIGTDQSMPDMKALSDAIEKGKKAVRENRNTYSEFGR